ALPLLVNRYRIGMVDMKRHAAAIPLLAVKAVYTSKGELIAEPIAKAFVIFVPAGAVPPRVRLGWVFESDHQAAPSFLGRPEASRFSSSSSTWLGRGATWST